MNISTLKNQLYNENRLFMFHYLYSLNLAELKEIRTAIDLGRKHHLIGENEHESILTITEDRIKHLENAGAG